MTIPNSRIQILNERPIQQASYVLYWMQQSQRAKGNAALSYAVLEANRLAKPLLVVFALFRYPEATYRHYSFMLEGLKETAAHFQEKGIKFIVRKQKPVELALECAKDACLVVVDQAYLYNLNQWRKQVAKQAQCRVIAVDADTLVPVRVASQKAEYAARTIRPKIHKELAKYLKPELEVYPEHPSLSLSMQGVNLEDTASILDDLKLSPKVAAVTSLFKGGTSQAETRLKAFLREQFASYSENRNQVQIQGSSHMSMYLQFGQISPIKIALAIRVLGKNDNVETYLEELIVRRELALNFTFYTPDYADYSCIPAWAKKTLAEHKQDKREYLYTVEDLEHAATHDPYWNAAMKEMRYTGYMHNYMRMYWAKKILEWSESPKVAFKRSLYLNNKYFLDGLNANSYAGVAWCYGVHDRAWFERPIFGKVRYMNAKGLKRKADPDAYVKRVDALIRDYNLG